MNEFFGALLGTMTGEGVSVMAGIAQVFEPLAETISVSNVVFLLTFAAAAAVGLAFMWWGVRKLVHVFMSAFKKGKVSL